MTTQLHDAVAWHERFDMLDREIASRIARARHEANHLSSLALRGRSSGHRLAVQSVSFEKQAVFSGPDGTVAHTELRRGAGVIAISSATPPVSGNPWSAVRHGVYAVVDDVDGHHAKASSAGARIAMAPRDTD